MPSTVFARVKPLGWVAAAVTVAATLAWAALDRWESFPAGVGGPWGGSVRRIVSLDAAGDTLVAATGGGIYRSTDGGDTWAAANAGLQSLDVTDVAVCAGTPSRLLATTYLRGAYASTDGGLSWVRVGEAALPDALALWRAAVDPVDPDRCYVADFASKLLGSSDGGMTWAVAGEHGVTRLLFASNRTLYFSTRSGRMGVLPLGGGGGLLPALAGLSPNTSIADFALPGGDGQTIVVAHEGNGLVVSVDGGTNWQERFFSSLVPPTNTEFTYIDAVAADPLNPSRILFHHNNPAGSGNRPTALYESTNLGLTRASLALPEKGMELSGDPGGGLFATPASEWILENKAGVFRRDGRAGAFAHSSRGMAAFDARDVAWGPAGALAVAGGITEAGNGGLYVWDGADWVRRARDLSANPGLDAGSTNIVRYHGNALWACQDGLGVFRSLDAGATWEDVSGGIGFGADDAFYGLAFAPDGSADALLGTQQGIHRNRGGTSWEVLQPITTTAGPSQATAWRVAADVRSPKGFFAAAANGGGQFWVTADAGTTWFDLTPSVFGNYAVALAASEQVGGHALVGTRFGGLWETFDGGETWAERGGEGLPKAEVAALALGGEADAYMAAAVRGNGVYLSGDAGTTWTRVLDGLSSPDGPAGNPLSVNALAFEPGTLRLVAAVQGGGLRYLEAAADTRAPIGTISPAGGTYPQPVKVRLGADERLASIYYTVDGGVPSPSSPLYAGPFLVTTFADVRFLPVDPAGNQGPIGSATYVITTSRDTAPTVTAAPRGGNYAGSVAVTLTADEPMANLYYTLDGTSPAQADGRTPSLSALVYDPVQKVAVTPPATLKFYGLDLADNPSPVGSETYLPLNDRTPPVLQANPPAGTFTAAFSVTLSANEPVSAIYYTVDGTTPTAASPRYSAPIPVSRTTTLRFYGVDLAGNRSAVQTVAYTVQAPSSSGGGGGGGCFVGSLGAALPSLPGWLCALALALSLAAGSARAAGPYGGSVQGLALAADGEKPRWAATWRGLFSFEGERWRRVEALGQRDLSAVLEAGGRLLAVETHRGLWASDDGGATWTQGAKGLAGPYGHPADDILCLRADPARPAHLFLGSAGQGAFESQDGGRTWKLLREGLEGQPPPAFHAKDLVPAAGDRPLLMGTDGAGVYAWGKAGWSRWGEGLPPKLRIQSLAANPRDPRHLALGSRGEGLWESRDGGKTWKLLRKGAYTVVGAAAVGPKGDVAAYFAGEGLAVAPPGGKVALLKGALESEILTLAPRGKGGWFAGLAHDGLAALEAGGPAAGWLNQGLDATRVLSIVEGTAPGELWCGDTNGVFHSADGGKTWEPRNRGLLPAAANALLWHGGRLLEGSNGQGVFGWDPEKGLWEDRSGGLGTSNTIYSLGQSADGKRLYVGTEGGVLRSDDGATLWTLKNQGLPPASLWFVAPSPAGDGVWAAGAGALFRSSDAGEHWERVAEARAIGLGAAVREGEERLWVLELQGLFALKGKDLVPVPLPLGPGERLASLVPGGVELWVGSTAGLWRVGAGEPVKVLDGPGVLATLPLSDGAILAGTDGRGVVVLGPSATGGEKR